MSDIHVHRAIGGAGTGKTRLILERLSEAREELGLSTDEIGFATFTRAGRAEIAERAADAWGVAPDDLTKGGWFRTAHSIAHRCCEVEKGQLIQGPEGDEWLSGALGGKVHTRSDARGERTYVSNGDDSIPLAMRAWELARSRMEPLDRVLRRWIEIGESCPDPSEAASIVRRYELAKLREGRLDFTDMIARFAGVKFTVEGPVETTPIGEIPESLRVLAVDEAQDSSHLVDRVCRRLAAGGRIERVWLCGDPYQCQPAGTPVLTLSGYKNIEDLDPAVDRLVAFSRREGRFAFGGSEFEIASRVVDSSSLVEITLADGTKHVCTDSHKWVVRTRGRKGTPMASRLIHAANLLPGIHRVPKMDGSRNCEWVDVVSCRRLPPGCLTRVWGMNVQKHHTYVTRGGVVTGNSIHSFAGGDYNHFLAWDAEEFTMPQSYRCRSEILALGERCLRQMHRGYRDRGILPAAPGGRVRSVGSAEEALCRVAADSSVLILGRCAFALDDYEAYLKSRRLPYQWVDKGHSAAQLSGYGSLWALQHGRACLGESLANAVAMLSVKTKELGTLLKRGAKAEWGDGRKSHLDIVRPTSEDYELAGFEQPLRELIRSGRWVEALEPRYRDRATVWHDAATKHGEALANNPPIRLSTIHSAKGLEADSVILSSVTSPSVERSRDALPESHDEECRVAYVAVTRAKESLTFVDDGFKYRMELPL